MSVVNFRHLTGAEMYVYELSRELRRRGHDVAIVSTIGGEITERARGNGVAVFDWAELPRKSLSFDIMHLNEKAPSEYALKHFPDTPAIATVHSQWECEDPCTDPRIRRYICIRPEIREKIIVQDGIPLSKTTLIYNGVDTGRFNESYAKRKTPTRWRLFAGTVDPLRRQAGLAACQQALEDGVNILFVGQRHDTWLDSRPNQNVYWLDTPQWEIERYVKAVDETVGIVLGRTTIEGWHCGKPGIIYDVAIDGSIKSCKRYEPPPPDVLKLFHSSYVADQVESIYADIVR